MLMDRIAIVWAVLLFFSPAARADLFIGVGGGIKHTSGPAFHLSAPIFHGIEGHYAHWQDGGRDHAVGLGYRFDNGSRFSFVFGFAYISRVTENLLNHNDAYLEVRWRFSERIACQIGHYSTVGDDAGENMLFCGWLVLR
jgi:hypothetical protein